MNPQSNPALQQLNQMQQQRLQAIQQQAESMRKANTPTTNSFPGLINAGQIPAWAGQAAGQAVGQAGQQAYGGYKDILNHIGDFLHQIGHPLATQFITPDMHQAVQGHPDPIGALKQLMQQRVQQFKQPQQGGIAPNPITPPQAGSGLPQGFPQRPQPQQNPL